MGEETREIRIPVDLYESVRAYCDQAGIRLIDHIQDALENAPRYDEVRDLLAAEAEFKKRLAMERSKALREGFSKGVLATTLALQGRSALSDTFTPQEVRSVAPPRVVRGDQLKLF